MLVRKALPLVALIAAGFVFHAAIDAQDMRKNPRRDMPQLPTLKVYEWGVSTANWDGSDEGPDDVPDFYYDNTEVKIEPEVERPAPDKPPVMRPRKPVLYFECDRDVTFDLDVKFKTGKVTWMYPKPNRLTDAGTVQWDNITVYPDSVARDKFAPPELHKVDKKHWSGYSRDGATSSVVVNGEHERFVFYEGERTGLPDADIYINQDGHPVVSNYTAHELLDLRVHVEVGAEIYTCYVARVPAAQGDTPGEVVLKDDAMVAQSDFLVKGKLTDETAAAGLTDAQARVFERVWRDDMVKVGTMSWRRTQLALDELMRLKLTLPAGIGSDIKRVGYVLIKGIDLERQAEFDDLVRRVADKDIEAVKELSGKGMAAAGAIRRAINAEDIDLSTRLKLAKILGKMGATD